MKNDFCIILVNSSQELRFSKFFIFDLTHDVCFSSNYYKYYDYRYYKYFIFSFV